MSENRPLDNKIRNKQQYIAALLTPIESYILLFERILVWELPYVSAAFIVSVHILFWLATTVRVYYLFGVTCMILVLLDVCFIHFVPQGRDNENSASTGWTELHTRLLGVPELSRAIAEYWVFALSLLDTANAMRSSNRPKFFVLSVIYLSVGAVIGAYLPGFWLAYFAVIGLLIWPCLSYHNLLIYFHYYINFVVDYFEHKLYIKRKERPHKGGHAKRGRRQVIVEDESDSDDAIIDEFLPSLNQTSIVTALTSALNAEPQSDDDDDEFEPHQTSLMPTLSQAANHSDDELLGDEVSMLSRGLGAEMPSVDDVDDSKDLIDNDADDGTELRLVDNDESNSEEDEDNFVAGLSFDEDTGNKTNSMVVSSDLLGGILGQGQSTVLAALSSPAVSSLLTTAAAGLNAVRDAVSRVQHVSDDTASDSDVLDAEFEFLNDDEFTD